MSLSAVLTVIGAALQAVGFFVTFVELEQAQRHEFPGYVPIHHRPWRWVSSKFGRTYKVEGTLAGTSVLTFGGTATAIVKRARPTDLAERVERLEEEADELRQRQREDRAAVTKVADELGERITTGEARLDQRIDETEAQRKTRLRESLVYQRIGVGLFLAGLAATAAGALT